MSGYSTTGVYLNGAYYPLPNELEARRYVSAHGGTVVATARGNGCKVDPADSRDRMTWF
ncbi:MAG: hypothetical protein ACRDPW_03230 [Mycobacteriales bacterium]